MGDLDVSPEKFVRHVLKPADKDALDAAKKDFAQYFQRQAARDDLKAEDFSHFTEAERLEKEGEVDFQLKKIRLVGNYKPPPGYENKMGGCVRRALREVLRVDVENLPENVGTNDLPNICAELRLNYYTDPKKVLSPKNKDIIVLYQNARDGAHAVVTNDLSEFSKRGKKIVGVIEIPQKN